MRVLKLLFESGDREALVVEARRLLDMETVEIGNLISLAQATREQKRALSKRLLTRAVAQGLPDDLVTAALVLAFELLDPDDKRTAQLMRRAMELGEQGIGGIHLASQSEFEVFVKDRARGVRKASELYASGQIPIHLLSDALNEPLGALMPLLLTASQALTEATSAIPFVRSGQMVRRLPSQIQMRRLMADYTALVIGEALGILDTLERELDVVLVPFHILVALQEAEDRMVKMQRQKDPSIKDVGRWLCTIQELREKLRLGVESGAYALLPEFPSSSEEEAPALGLSARCLRGLLLADTQEGDVFWSDDRYLNGHSMMGVAPIASTYELLAHLQNVGALTQEERFAANHTLRSWRCMFLPLEKEEIAHVASSGKAEPKRILRQWVATTYLSGTALQINPANTPSGMGEFKLFLDLHRAVEDSIIQIWADESAELDVREERATWILSELFASALTVRRQTNLSRGQENSLQLEALSASALFTHAFLQLKPAIWNRYFEWLDRQVLQPRAKSEPLLVRAIAEGIAAMLLNRETWAEFDFGEQEKRYLSVFAASLPGSLKPFVLEDQEVRDELGFATTVAIQRFHFTADEFYRGMTKVQEEGSANLELLEGEDTVSVSAIGELPAQEFTLREPDGTEIKFAGEELVLLDGTAAERRSFLEERRHWFDCNQREFRQRVEHIASDPDPRRRAEAARAAKSSSISVFLQALRARLAETRSFELQSLLPPDSAAAISYFGLDRIGDAENAAAEMLEEMSESEVLSRFIALPSPLPKILEERLVSLQPRDRLAAIENALQETRSPISVFHIARLMMVAPAGPDSVARAQQLLLSSLSSEGREEAELLLRILAWAESQLAHDREVDHAPIAVQVALPWAWASKTHSTFIRAGADPRKLTEIFEQGRAAQIPASVLAPGSLLTADISRSTNQSVSSLLLSGVAFALGEGAPYSDELVGAMSDLLFLEDSEGHTLSLTLWQNTSGATDALRSLLGGTWEEKLKPLLGEAGASISNVAAGNRVRFSLRVIQDAEDESARAWTTLQAVLGDFPVPNEWREDVAACLVGADLRAIASDDAIRGAMAYYFACGQARYLVDDGITSNLAAQVSDLSHYIVSQQENGDATGSWLLFDAILRLATAAPSALDASRAAAELLGEAVRDAPGLAIVWEPGIWALADRLPLEQGQAFWPLLLRIRASAMGEPDLEASQA